MMIDIRVPAAGESITQVELARWLAKDGQYVEKDQEIAEIDSDKATLTINAEQAGILSISMEEGSSTEPGKVIGTIDTSAEKPEENAVATDKEAKLSVNDADSPLKTVDNAGNKDRSEKQSGEQAGEKTQPKAPEAEKQPVTFSPQAKKALEVAGINAGTLTGHPENKRITKKDVLAALASGTKKDQPVDTTERDQDQHQKNENTSPVYKSWGGGRQEDRQKMSALRRKIAERLVAVKNQTAMLSTFNEVDMTALIELRSTYQKAFTEKYGLKLGYMSFFARALAESIPYFPGVNGYIDGDHIVYPGYADIGIAVSTPKGLMVPVIRNAESMSIDQLEAKIQELAAKARDGKISIEELTGGTISITNGGIFGSMLSTPILNPPQSAILGMHNIIERPVAINGKVEIRPMMYLALSYDHRVVDGRESVGFLVKVKEMIEQPALMALHGKPAESLLLGL